jgi:hypothetical protein
MLRRRISLGAGFLALVLLVAAPALHARARRAGAGPAREIRVAAARVLGMPDLVLSTSSRWLRHPSQSEPGAAFADAPASLDVDPGGAIVGPPLELFFHDPSPRPSPRSGERGTEGRPVRERGTEGRPVREKGSEGRAAP